MNKDKQLYMVQTGTQVHFLWLTRIGVKTLRNMLRTYWKDNYSTITKLMVSDLDDLAANVLQGSQDDVV